MANPELIVYVSNPKALTAAVQAGADAVYISPYVPKPPSKKAANIFTRESFISALSYCRVRGVRTYLDLDRLIADDEIEALSRIVRTACHNGIDAIAAGDMGLFKILSEIAPKTDIFGGLRLCVHNIAGVNALKDAGFARVTAAPQLSARELEYICTRASVGVSVPVYGKLCASYPGACSFSSFYEDSCANTGNPCDRCRMGYCLGIHPDSTPLSMKDLSLYEHLPAITKMGACSVTIKPSTDIPEYIKTAVNFFHKYLSGAESLSAENAAILGEISPFGGVTDGFYTENTGSMEGTSKNLARTDSALKKINVSSESKDMQRIPIEFSAIIKKSQPAILSVRDMDGNVCQVSGPIPHISFDHPLISAKLNTQLYKLEGTPYLCQNAKSRVDDGIYLTNEQIAALCKNALDKLSSIRSMGVAKETDILHSSLRPANTTEPPVFTVSVAKAAQLSSDMLALNPAIVYVPMTEILENPERVVPFIKSEDTDIAVILPDIITDRDSIEVKSELLKVYSMGISHALVSSVSHIGFARSCGFSSIHGDFGMNVFNSHTLKDLRAYELTSAALSFECSGKQLREMSKYLDTEVLVYGRIPLMLTEHCLIKQLHKHCVCDNRTETTDDYGNIFPVLKKFGCRTQVYSSKKLFLAHKQDKFLHLGAWGARLAFTTENARECVQVFQRYLKIGKYSPNNHFTGLYK